MKIKLLFTVLTLMLISMKLSMGNEFAKSISDLSKASKNSKVTFSMRGKTYFVDTAIKKGIRTEESKRKATFFMSIAALLGVLGLLIGNSFSKKVKMIGEFPEFDFEDKIFSRAMEDYLKDTLPKNDGVLSKDSESKIQGKIKVSKKKSSQKPSDEKRV